MEWLITYLLVGLLFGEGLLKNGKDNKKRVPPWEYIVIIFLWGPMFLIFVVVVIGKTLK